MQQLHGFINKTSSSLGSEEKYVALRLRAAFDKAGGGQR
jgi:hypothetical protein